jgi:hypothetical protein
MRGGGEMANVSQMGNLLVFVPADDCLLDLDVHPEEASLRPGGPSSTGNCGKQELSVLPRPGLRNTREMDILEG